MQKTTDDRIALVALIAFAAWLLIALPLIYMPGEWHSHGEMIGVKYGEWLLFLATMALFWATWRLVKGADKTAECQLRAYVGIADHKLSGFAENQIPKIILHIKNFGQTPARKLQYWAASGFASYPLNTQLPLQSFRPETISIFPSDNFSPVITLAQPLNSADMAGLQSGNRRLYVYGHIKYEDVFGQTRNTGFRLMYGGADNLSIGRMLWAEAGSYDD